MSLDAEPAAAGEPESEALSLHDELREAIRADAARQEADTAPPVEDAEETATEARARDEKGRFAPKDAAPETAPENEAGEEPAPKATEQPERLQAPTGWPADAKTAWDKLPKAVQASLADDLTAGRFRLAGDASGATTDPILATVRQYEDDARQVGVEPRQYVENTLAWARHLARDPVRYLPQVAQALGVDLSQYAAMAANADQRAQGQPPELTALQSEVQQLRRFVAEQQRAEEDRRMASVNAELEAFKSEKDTAGNPLRPYWSELPEAALAARIQLIRQQRPGLSNRQVLQEAYEAETYAHPEIRKREIARVAAERAKADEEKRVAAAAKARSVSVRDARSPSSMAPAAAYKDLRDELAERVRSSGQERL